MATRDPEQTQPEPPGKTPDPPGPTDTGTLFTPGTDAECEGDDTYPPGAVEPMALGQVLSPYSWSTAIHNGTGTTVDLDLAQVPCDLDPEIDWSLPDVLLFMSIPFW